MVEQLRRFFAEAIGYPVPRGRGRAGLVRPVGRPAIALAERYGLVVHGAAWPTKLWPEERWRNLILRLTAIGRAVVLPWGDAEERRRAVRLADGIAGALPLSRKLDGEEVAELVAAADFAIGIDTGLMHLAAAFDVPGVTLFGPTDVKYAIPYGADQRAVSSDHLDAPCQQVRCTREAHGQCCMREVDPDDAYNYAMEKKQENGNNGFFFLPHDVRKLIDLEARFTHRIVRPIKELSQAPADHE